MRERAAVLTIVLVLLAVAPATSVVTAHDGHAYEGTHVAFEADNHGIVEYTVDDRTTMESVRVQSQSEVDSRLGVGADASASVVSDIDGSVIFVDDSTGASATVDAMSGATMTAHDDGHGSLVVTADDEAQYVEVGLGDDASAEQSADGGLVVTTADGTEQAYVVAGEGEVAMNDDGNVTAAIEQGSRLVVRSYPNGTTSEDEREAMLVDGTVAANADSDTADPGRTAEQTADTGPAEAAAGDAAAASSESGPGFGILASLAALAVVVGIRVQRGD